ncbi:hypothetical protein ACXR2U_13445 [Jatrophihabitans sp. YIM 134969]
MTVLPRDGRDQSCAVCGVSEVAWVHPLAAAEVTYRRFERGHTLPQYWCICAGCESLHDSGDDDALATRYLETQGGDAARPPEVTAQQWRHEVAEKPVAVWRRADLGARPIPPA